ncbi:MAG: metal-dependent transcriptional regulator [Candidatus Cardinium sp.]|uniref:metal-dependent transcriptional regulator n=1 Tax=Cardinium endosymbiont of Dermatophagoides farinae TaxID=2597823 RepID=UPI001182BE3A|nr:metal-dependent transcriptional regulator [Cardinium endosymbiont of Dermatophagoides farinae]TSJ80881.1 metal-dependent transcriptional regulator [Cardinium endosymbiont of Dermatophagoides farinae]UWW96891.1 MAG: metal-dependent transcriptional regulator [Candidatus Cardinium sp.]
MKRTHAEENYLKAIYMLSEKKEALVTTTAMAEFLHTSAASITDMVQKLHNKGLVVYRKYQGVALTETGKQFAIKILRKHLLWEVFLVDKLKFGWSEIHEIAEQLEHIDSDILIDRLDDFLGHPYCNPHGIVIPNADGKIITRPRLLMTDLSEGASGIVSAIKDDSTSFLQYLGKRNIYLGVKITVVEKIEFDESMDVTIDNQHKINISRKITDNILISL